MKYKEKIYLVVKIEDALLALTNTEKAIFEHILDKIDYYREEEGKEPNEYIVCNQDEPYSGDVWDCILKGEEALNV